MIDADRLTALGVEACVAASKYYPLLGRIVPLKYEKWSKGKKLKMLLVGYNGARNTGADVRVAAMVKQFESVLGRGRVEISIFTQDISNFKIYFEPHVKLIPLSPVYFKDVFEACCTHHMAVLCEGSTLKSKFANALTLFFCEAAGIMKSQGKPCIAYGSEAGYMDEFVRKVASQLCSETYFIARTKPSLKIIHELGLSGHVGTDTAWSFPATKMRWAKERLKAGGWNGKSPVIGVAVINPFWWPVKPSFLRLARSFVTRSWKYHYRKWYFFSSSRERERKFEKYLTSIASATSRFAEKISAHVVIIGMEALDLEACKKLQNYMRVPAEIFSSRFYDGYQLSSLLRVLSVLVTSRYHARVLSMAGGVPAIAVSMDERLENIFGELGHREDFYLEVDDEQLEEKLEASLDRLWERRWELSNEIMGKVPFYLEKMGQMGIFLHWWLTENFPGIELNPPPASWRDALGPVDEQVEKILSSC